MIVIDAAIVLVGLVIGALILIGTGIFSEFQKARRAIASLKKDIEKRDELIIRLLHEVDLSKVNDTLLIQQARAIEGLSEEKPSATVENYESHPI